MQKISKAYIEIQRLILQSCYIARVDLPKTFFSLLNSSKNETMVHSFDHHSPPLTMSPCPPYLPGAPFCGSPGRVRRVLQRQ